MSRRPLCPLLFPYTTLFRSVGQGLLRQRRRIAAAREAGRHGGTALAEEHGEVAGAGPGRQRVLERPLQLPVVRVRSEEHTSELQSRGHLVCHLLLENKKKTI